MSRVRLLVSMVTALLASLIPTFACQCRRRYTPEELYCKSEYAIEVKILSGTPILSGRYYEYEIEVLNNYTPSPEFDSARQVIQADDTSSCSVQLDVGSTYLLMGDISKDRKLEQSAQSILSTKFCDLYHKLSSNTEAAETEAGYVMGFLDKEKKPAHASCTNTAVFHRSFFFIKIHNAAATVVLIWFGLLWI